MTATFADIFENKMNININSFELGVCLLGVMLCLYMYVVCQIIDMGDVFYRKQRQLTNDRIASLESEVRRLVSLTETHDKLIMVLCSKGFRKSLNDFPVFNELFASGQIYHNPRALSSNDVQYCTTNSTYA